MINQADEQLGTNGNGVAHPSGSFAHAESWWGGRWVRALAQLLNTHLLARGRTYAGSGRLLDLDFGVGVVTAQAQADDGSVCQLRVELQTFDDDTWRRVTATMAERAIYAAQLLNGEMPMDIEAVFNAEGESLFPASRREFHAQCSCAGYARPCQHVAAVLWVIGERIDDDPFLLFTLRGRTKEQFLAALREARSRGAERGAPTSPALVAHGAETLGDELRHFWRLGPQVEALPVHVAPPEVEMEAIKVLGDPTFAEDHALMERLTRIYRAVTRKAQEVAFDE